MKNTVVSILFCSAMLTTAGCSVRNTEPPRAVFLIIVDTLRPDRISSYGYTAHETSAMDRLAHAGVLYEQAHSVASWTVPSMGAMMTSRYPTQLGLVERPGDPDKKYEWREKRQQLRYTLPQNVTTLAEIMTVAGYQTAAFVNQPFINFKDGFLQGFSEWCYPVAQDKIEWHDTRRPIPSIDFASGTDLGKADPLLVAEFEEWLENNADQQSFVWLHLLTTHWPYTPPTHYMEGRAKAGKARSTERYDGEIRQVDEMIAAVLEAIDSHVGLDKSLVILTSDHGEAFGEHRMQEHGHSLHREVIQVPLMLAGRGVPRGKKVESYVRTIDILPTILDLTGQADLAPDGTEGESLVPTFEGDAIDRMVYSEGMLYGSTERSLTASGYKLMYDEQGPAHFKIFECTENPGESIDLSKRLPSHRDRTRDALVKIHDRLVKDFNAGIGTEVGSGQEDDSVLRSMKALGYIKD